MKLLGDVRTNWLFAMVHHFAKLLENEDLNWSLWNTERRRGPMRSKLDCFLCVSFSFVLMVSGQVINFLSTYFNLFISFLREGFSHYSLEYQEKYLAVLICFSTEWRLDFFSAAQIRSFLFSRVFIYLFFELNLIIINANISELSAYFHFYSLPYIIIYHVWMF